VPRRRPCPDCHRPWLRYRVRQPRHGGICREPITSASGSGDVRRLIVAPLDFAFANATFFDDQIGKLVMQAAMPVVLTRANQTTTSLLAHYHLLELIGENRLYPTNRHA